MSTPPRSTPLSLLAAWLCAVTGIGCPAAQVKPPEPSRCPDEATTAMFRELEAQKTLPNTLGPRAIVDINQPGDQSESGVYLDGPVIGRITTGAGKLPEGTLLHGRLWTGPGIYDSSGEAAIIGRYTLAVLPDGRKYPVCFVLGDCQEGRIPKGEGSKPGATVLPRELPVCPVSKWP